jgi:lysophospholipase L1-like esterase
MKYLFLLLMLLLHSRSAQDKLRIFLAGDSTMSVKDSNAWPETGWGMPFSEFWDSGIVVVNTAMNGRSTGSFIREGRWKSILHELKAGDYVFIQFGHNDESPEKKDRYTPPEQYVANLLTFCQDAIDRAAIPVLLTPVGRRRFDNSGKVMETHTGYSALVRETARKTHVTLIDLDSLSMGVYQQLGPEASRLLFLHLRPGEHPNYPSGKEDNTHFNELGALLMAQQVLAEIRRQIPALAQHIKQLSRAHQKP